MMKLSYDLHLHSCLSPCGDNDMTPNNIVNMAVLNGLDMIALTDHNTCRNCPALLEVAREAGLLAVPGMELCTAEEIHVVCLFPTLEAAMDFDRYVYAQIPDVKNNTRIFGDQFIMDAEDQAIGTEEKLLINASMIPVLDVGALVASRGGAAFPAHIDKNAYSVLSSLGDIPPECGFSTVEVKNPGVFLADAGNLAKIDGRMVITDSDAHYLWDIAEPVHFIELPACSANSLLAKLRAGGKG